MQIPTKDLFAFAIIVTIIFLLGGVFLVLYVQIYNERKRKHAEEQNQLKSSFAQTLLQTQIEIQQQTLTTVSRELHDNLGQIASLIKINLNTFPIHDKEKAAEQLEETKTLLRTLITDMKTLSVSLNGDRVVQAGLQKSLDNELVHLKKTGLFEVDFSVEGNIPALDPNHTLILFRMLQELLNNMVKHSEAKHIKIKIIASEIALTLVVSDDGKGFDLQTSMKQEGSGLLNLQQRAKLIGADFSIQSEILKGTQVTIKLPLQNASYATPSSSSG